VSTTCRFPRHSSHNHANIDSHTHTHTRTHTHTLPIVNLVVDFYYNYLNISTFHVQGHCFPPPFSTCSANSGVSNFSSSVVVWIIDWNPFPVDRILSLVVSSVSIPNLLFKIITFDLVGRLHASYNCSKFWGSVVVGLINPITRKHT